MQFKYFLFEDRNMVDGKDTSVYHTLLSKYKSKEKHLWFCSFTKLKSLQINFTSYAIHKTDYNTPIGIYSYPIFLSKKYIESYNYTNIDKEGYDNKVRTYFPFQDGTENCILFKISYECYKNVWTNFKTNGYEEQYFSEEKLLKKTEELKNILIKDYKNELISYFILDKHTYNYTSIQKILKNIFENIKEIIKLFDDKEYTIENIKEIIKNNYKEIENIKLVKELDITKNKKQTILDEIKKQCIDVIKTNDDTNDILQQKLSELIEKIKPIVIKAMKTNKVKNAETNYIGQFLYLLYQLVYKNKTLDNQDKDVIDFGKFKITYYNILGKTNSNQATITELFLKLGCSGLIDNGSGYIHTNERIQAVFFKTSYLKNELSLYNDLKNSNETKSEYSKQYKNDEIEMNKDEHTRKKNIILTIIKFLKKQFKKKIKDVLVNNYYISYDDENYINNDIIQNVIFTRIDGNNLKFDTCYFNQINKNKDKINLSECKFNECNFKSNTYYGTIKDSEFTNCNFTNENCFLTLENCRFYGNTIQTKSHILYKNCTIDTDYNVIDIIPDNLDLYNCSYNDYKEKLLENTFIYKQAVIQIIFIFNKLFISVRVKSNNYKETINKLLDETVFNKLQTIAKIENKQEKLSSIKEFYNNLFGEKNIITLFDFKELD